MTSCETDFESPISLSVLWEADVRGTYYGDKFEEWGCSDCYLDRFLNMTLRLVGLSSIRFTSIRLEKRPVSEAGNI